MSRIKKYLPALVILAIMVFFAYFNSLNNAFVSDDRGFLQMGQNLPLSYFLNPPLRIARNFFIFVGYTLGNNSPLFYRLINIFFHIGVVWIIYYLFSLLANPTLAFLTAILFSVHPIFVESVSWISGGVYVQYTFFLLISLLFYILRKKENKYYFFSIAFYVLALFTMADKAIIFPLILVVYEISMSTFRKNWRSLIPFFLISLLIGFYYLQTGDISQRFSAIQTEFYQEGSTFNPLIQIPIAITSYLQLLFWPDKLTLYHSEMSFSWIEYLVRVLGLLVGLGLLGKFWRRNRMLFFWLAVFFISLLPTLTPFGISWIVAERYVYLGSIGVVGVVGYGLWKLTQNKKTEVIGYLLLVISVLGLLTRTIIRNFDWKNEDTLWIATGKTSPSDPKTHNNLGDVYGRWGDLKRSAEEFKIAIRLNPRYADAYHNLGNTYWQIGSPSAALENFQLALKYNPNLWQSHQNIAAIYFDNGNYEEAKAEIQKALKIYPANPQLYVNMGVIYLKLQDKKRAEEYFLKALQIDPNNQQAKLGLLEVNK